MGRVIRVGIAWALSGLFVAGSLTISAAPAGAEEPPLDPEVPGDCEWFGEATHDRTQIYDRPAAQARQTDVSHMEARSTPIAGRECGAVLSGTFTMDYFDVDEITCTPAGSPSYNTTVTYRQEIDVSGTELGVSDTMVYFDGPNGEPRMNLYWYADDVLKGTRTYSMDGGCQPVEPSTMDCATDPSAALNAYCTYDPGRQFGPCQDTYGQAAEAFYFPETAQALAGSCTLSYVLPAGSDGATITVEDTATWRLRRTICDETVDTDGGGVGDCDEFDLRTDPLDAADDGAEDTDGDGFVDTVDRCISVPGVASADGCPDADGDGVSDLGEDNCLGVPNSGQEDLDGDGAGDACDSDADGDGLADSGEPGVGLDPRDPDTDDDTVLDGADDCPLQSGDPDNRGCPLFARLDVTASYAFSGFGGALNGGLSVDLEGTAIGVIPIEQVCFSLTWEAQASGFSTSQLLWNGVAGAFLDQTTPVADGTADVVNDTSKRRWEQDVSMAYCTVPVANAGGLYAGYPWDLIVAGPGGRIHKVEIDDVVMTVIGDGGSTIATVGLDDNKSKGKALNVSWFEQDEVTVDF